MTTSQSGETAGKARSGIGDAVVGKAKEVAGAVTGNDSLAAEGQLQQSRAHTIRESAAREAIADAEAAEAGQQLRRVHDEAAAQRGQVEARAAEQASAIRDEQLHQQTVAERSVEVEESAGQQAAEDRARQQMLRAGEQEQTRGHRGRAHPRGQRLTGADPTRESASKRAAPLTPTCDRSAPRSAIPTTIKEFGQCQ
jgi:uncharacterized protein YjbJ (UPF0337 family)